ncbi:hypothetical protein [Pedosphaera parvula]|uniref:Uncharacterized protein n=1 Tax=Pedosphaera parvula (strain Ellin514) TaxID=320771 RepID=B9XHQ3_PEDPL|nr:hypothetical protein [Pedosphaera parvula]EEF60631.1 hypothetical protein Cflav_PD6222 [Pedosphaera parvula Ellin514]
MNATSQEPQTVIVTTKNTASLTLGIIALVVGVLSLLVGWIPFLGLLAIPVAIIGLLLAGIGFVIALFKSGKGIGMPLLGGVICVGALVLPILSTGGTSAAITRAVEESSRKSRSSTSQKKVQEDEETKAKTAYIQEHLSLYDVQARYMDSILDGKVPGVLFKLRNTGDRDLEMVKVTVLFKDATGAVIHEEDYTPVLVSKYSLRDNKPLKAGYVWQMESGKFYSAKSVPTEWKEGAVDAKISDVRFTK